MPGGRKPPAMSPATAPPRASPQGIAVRPGDDRLADVEVVERLDRRVEGGVAGPAAGANRIWSLNRVTACLRTGAGGRPASQHAIFVPLSAPGGHRQVLVAHLDRDPIQVRGTGFRRAGRASAWPVPRPHPPRAASPRWWQPAPRRPAPSPPQRPSPPRPTSLRISMRQPVGRRRAVRSALAADGQREHPLGHGHRGDPISSSISTPTTCAGSARWPRTGQSRTTG